MLTLSDYQKEALKTSDETNTLEYCVLGLVSEAGEVAGVVKKWLRGDYDEATMRAKMLDELGDVLWYVAVTDTRIEWYPDPSDVFRDETFKAAHFDMMESYAESGLNLNVEYATLNLASAATGVGAAIEDEDQDQIWYCLGQCLCFTVLIADGLKLDLADIAAHNIAKLRDRQERGVIRGSGDGR